MPFVFSPHISSHKRVAASQLACKCAGRSYLVSFVWSFLFSATVLGVAHAAPVLSSQIYYRHITNHCFNGGFSALSSAWRLDL